MRKFSLLTFIFFVSFQSFSFESTKEYMGCIEGKIKFVEIKGEKIIDERYCYDSVLRKIYSAGKCRPNQKCLADREDPIEINKRELSSLKVNFGFNLCKKINGLPQSIEFWDKEKWIKTSRCVFKDGSYIDIGTLETKVKYIE